MKSIKTNRHLCNNPQHPDDVICSMGWGTPSIRRTGLVKKIILLVSETLIQTGIFLQNICQPSIEETIRDYRQNMQNRDPQAMKKGMNDVHCGPHITNHM